MHVLTAEQFSTEQLSSLFNRADELRAMTDTTEGRRELASYHIGHQLCTLFYEPSTRTRMSFEMGAAKMGMGIVSTENAREFSSAIKGETLEDTIRTINTYGPSVIVLRHHETGAAAKAAAVSEIPIINAGDGKGEHPTQALLDADTIYRKFGRLSNLHVVMGGDLAHGRTVRSLAKLLSKYDDNQISFVSTPELQIGEDIKAKLQVGGTHHEETDDMLGTFKTADVVYWTRLQKERGAMAKNNFTIDAQALEVIPKDAIIMHPLPRNEEIHPMVDNDPRAHYFKQAGNGLYIRMALMDQILTSKS